MNIKKGDTVKIIAGKDKGKTGKVLKTYPEIDRILVENINMLKKHKRPTKQGGKGEIVSLARPFHASNAMIVCQNCGKTARIGHRLNGDKKVRYCKKCKSIV